MVEPSDTALPVEHGQVIGRWTLRRQLGKGGMGQAWKVFELTDAGHAMVGVMKLHLANGVGDESTLRRWAVEVRVLMMLQGCANVVQILDMGVDRGMFYFVMEYVHGTDLGELVRLLRRSREKFAPDTVAWIGGEIIGGLKAIHNLVIAGVPQHLRHLDIGLKNLLVSVRGDIKIADFGVASGSQDPPLTNRGTYKYMAPEHFMGVPSQKSDIFAFGAVMWELLEREHYRAGQDDAALRAEIAAGKVRALRRTDVSPQLAGLVHDCLDPAEKRRPTAEEALARLEHMAEYRVQRSKVCEVMGRHFTGARSSGHTELIEALPADVTPDLAGLLAASKILVERGGGVELARVFRGMKKPSVAAGHSAAPVAAPEDDAPRPPGLFGAPDEEDDGDDDMLAAAKRRAIASPPGIGAGPAVDTVPEHAEGAIRRRDARTTRLPEGLQQQRMGTPPPMPMVHLLAAGGAGPTPHAPVVAAQSGVPQRAEPDAETPWQGAPSEATGPRTAAVAGTDRVDDMGIEGPSRMRQVAMLVGGGLLAIALGGGAALIISMVIAGDAERAAAAVGPPLVTRTAAVAEVVAVAPADRGSERGPVLRPVAPQVAEVEAAAVEAAAVVEAAVVEAAVVEAAVVEAAVVEAAVVEPAVVEPAVVAATPVVEPAAADGPSAPPPAELAPAKPAAPPKAKRVEKVKVEIRNEWIKPGVEVKIGKRIVTATGSAWLELPAGTYAIKWRPVGSPTWQSGGKLELKAGFSHIVLVGKVGRPSGVRHVPQRTP